MGLDAIARKDFDDLRDELGDLLFQVVFYAQMGQEQGLFAFDDVYCAISDKLSVVTRMYSPNAARTAPLT